MLVTLTIMSALVAAELDPDALNRRGQAAWVKDDLTGAYAAFTLSLVHAYSPQTIWNRGRVLEELGARDAALAHFEWLRVDAAGLEPSLAAKLELVRARAAAPAATSTPLSTGPSLGCAGPEMIPIAPGPFWRPTQVGRVLEPRIVYLSAYCIDRVEVSVQGYSACVTAGHCYEPALRASDPLAPVVGVSWQDAQDHCRWRGASLPTEAQLWRAGLGVSEGWAGRVGSVSADGVRDALGRAAEWVEDRFGFVPTIAPRDPRGAASGTQRLSIGAPEASAAASGDALLAARWRRAHAPDNRMLATVSFRCADAIRVRGGNE